MKTTLCFLALAPLLSLPLRAQTQPNPPPASASSDASLTAATERLQQQLKPAKHPKSDKWVFSILPVGLDPNPQLDYVIVTELTDAGRKLPLPSFDNPVYYVSHSVDQKNIGDAYGGMKDIPYKNLQKNLLAALASNGYRPYDPAHPKNAPTQVLFFAWGMHNNDNTNADSTDSAGDTSDDSSGDGSDGTSASDADTASGESSTASIQLLLSRAKTVGGRKFADEFAKALADQITVEEIAHRVFGPPYPIHYDGDYVNGLGQELHHATPLRDFAGRDDTTSTLVYETVNECYYMIVTSYDLDALKSHERKLLWVTRISTTARGVNFEQTLPIMINNGAYFFGRETPPEILRKRAYKRATVDIGDPTVVEYMTGTAAATGTSAPAREKGKEKENN